MDKQCKISIENEIKHFSERYEGLLQWLQVHGYEHPNFAQNLSDLRVVLYKIECAQARLKERKAKLGIQPLTIPITY